MCAAPEANCVLLADSSLGIVVRVALAEKSVVECLFRAPQTEGTLSGLGVLSGGAHIALAVYKRDSGGFSNCVLLLARESNAWRVAHELRFDTTPLFPNYFPRLCVSWNLLLCAVLRFSCRLVALQNDDSQLLQRGHVIFDSPISAMCAFTSGNEHLVATAHVDRTVRLSCHVATAAAAEDTIALE